MKTEILDWATSQMKKAPEKTQINEIEMSKKQKEMNKKKNVKEITKVDQQICRSSSVVVEKKGRGKGSVRDSIAFFEQNLNSSVVVPEKNLNSSVVVPE